MGSMMSKDNEAQAQPQPQVQVQIQEPQQPIAQPAQQPQLVQQFAAPAKGDEDEDEEEEVPTVQDVIEKLREAREILYKIADAEEKAKQPMVAEAAPQPMPMAAPGEVQQGGKKKRATRTKKQKGGFLDAQRAVLNISDLSMPRDGYTRIHMPDLKTMPSTTFSGTSVIDQTAPMNFYTGLLPGMGLTGGAAKKNSKAKKAT